ncbi:MULTISPECIES: hypothetical protein [Rhizobium/Agrobacterium group]|jgi:hypothetical protein|nr:hypothetical protein [Rhizobium nepotum]
MKPNIDLVTKYRPEYLQIRAYMSWLIGPSAADPHFRTSENLLS